MMFRVSRLYWPVSVIPKNAFVNPKEGTSRSQKLMVELGLIKPTGNGYFHVLPVAQKALDNCCKIISSYLEEVNCQKISLPILTNTSLWKKTGRLNDVEGEIFRLKDKHGKEYVLSPTHEESVTDLLSMSSPISYKQLPIRLFQIGPKFRDEIKPRFGLLRAKEFTMLDLYSFDKSREEAEITYNEISEQYTKILNALEIPWMKVQGNSGTIGGTQSHEYHILSNIGEDKILKCENCSFEWNEELYKINCNCPLCGSGNLVTNKGIEVAHTFLLEDKYSSALGANAFTANGKQEPLLMGCFGIGVTRLLAACLEVLSKEDNLVWPVLLAPFDICLITPKEGSKEQIKADKLSDKIYTGLVKTFGERNVIVDDRTSLTIGKRLLDSKRMGYPLVAVIGTKAMETVPKFELHYTKEGTSTILDYDELLNEIRNYKIAKDELKRKTSSEAPKSVTNI